LQSPGLAETEIAVRACTCTALIGASPASDFDAGHNSM
jgi:hypothetical protein